MYLKVHGIHHVINHIYIRFLDYKIMRSHVILYRRIKIQFMFKTISKYRLRDNVMFLMSVVDQHPNITMLQQTPKVMYYSELCLLHWPTCNVASTWVFQSDIEVINNLLDFYHITISLFTSSRPETSQITFNFQTSSSHIVSVCCCFNTIYKFQL